MPEPFSKRDKPRRSVLVSVRVTPEQDELLERLGSELGKAELVRQAIDYWLANSPDAKRLVRQSSRG